MTHVNDRIPLPDFEQEQGGGKLVFDSFSCEELKLLSMEGASGIVYQAVSFDYYGKQTAVKSNLILKECYPVDLAEYLVRNGDELHLVKQAPQWAHTLWNTHKQQYYDAFKKHIELYQSPAKKYITVPVQAYEANGTIYLISDSSQGATLSNIPQEVNALEKVKILRKCCEFLAYLHKQDLLYLDLKPSNIFVSKNTNGNFSGDIQLFDFDSIRAEADCNNNQSLISNSGNWSSYEQTHRTSDRPITKQSDIYSLGAILFWIVFGRSPKANEILVTNGDWSTLCKTVSSKLSCSETIAALVCDFLSKSLVADAAKRFQSIETALHSIIAIEKALEPINSVTLSALNQLEEKINKSSIPATSKFTKARKKICYTLAALCFACSVLLSLFVYLPAWQHEKEVTERIEGEWHAVIYDINGNAIICDSSTMLIQLNITDDNVINMQTRDSDGKHNYVFSWKYIGERQLPNGEVSPVYSVNNGSNASIEIYYSNYDGVGYALTWLEENDTGKVHVLFLTEEQIQQLN